MKSYFVCPYCHKSVKDLKGHLARVHPDKTQDVVPKNQDHKNGTTTSSAKVLEVKVPQPKVKPAESEIEYHCIDCGASISKGQANCPGCGEALDWSQVE